jgi:peptidoglycan/LPS O-acetylase OafA/YrhL
MQTVRHHALDNLRVFVIFLVVLLHAALSYMAYAPEWWYVLDPQRSLFFTGLVLVIDVPLMLIMFFLAGHFTYASLAKRGPGAFLKDKLVRIGLPWIFGVLVLAPPTAYLIYYSRKIPMGFWTFWRTEFWGRAFQQSVYWYLGVLLLFFALTTLVYALSQRFATWKPEVKFDNGPLLGTFLLAVTAASLLLSLVYPLDLWSHIYLLVYQPARIPLYVGYYVLGIVTHQRGWFTEGGYAPSLGRWLPLCLVSGLVYLGWRLAPVTQPHLAKAVTALLFNAFCFTSLMASLAVFRTWFGAESAFWRNQARNSYGVYYLHPLILYPLALAFVPLPLSIFFKAPAITLLAYLASWGLSAAILTRLPGLRRMF